MSKASNNNSCALLSLSYVSDSNMTSFHLHTYPVSKTLVLLHKWGSWVSGQGKNSPRVTQLLSSGVWSWSQVDYGLQSLTYDIPTVLGKRQYWVPVGCWILESGCLSLNLESTTYYLCDLSKLFNFSLPQLFMCKMGFLVVPTLWNWENKMCLRVCSCMCMYTWINFYSINNSYS